MQQQERTHEEHGAEPDADGVLRWIAGVSVQYCVYLCNVQTTGMCAPVA
jgi:hypothetical protein